MSSQQLPYPILILMADDDADDRLMVEEAFEENHISNLLHFVEDGQQLVDYLKRTNSYTRETAPRPGLILLDLNMPKKDGKTALTEIKADPQLTAIPIVVLTTSGNPAEIARAYELGASGYIKKPATFAGLVTAVQKLTDYWGELVETPAPSDPQQVPSLP